MYRHLFLTPLIPISMKAYIPSPPQHQAYVWLESTRGCKRERKRRLWRGWCCPGSRVFHAGEMQDGICQELQVNGI
jgi:hypothetical protein